jgi:hypothetical protein
VPGCLSKPFTRHYGLERHFVTVHQGQGQGETGLFCDYEKCPSKQPLRKDSCRQHYREYHAEDLIKRGNSKPKPGKVNRSTRKPETAEKFLAARTDHINLRWWRCSKCMRRVRVGDDGYVCPCKAVCEPERVAWREKARKSGTPARAAGSTAGFSSDPLDYWTACEKCGDMWLPDKRDPQPWVSCPRCRAGVN